MKDKLKNIINHYGINTQQRQFAEEVFELQEAITKAEQIKKLNQIFDKKTIAEEIADCMVMLNQFKEYYNITDEQINTNIAYKVNRQIERIEKENNKCLQCGNNEASYCEECYQKLIAENLKLQKKD